ncbi:MAG: DUF3991 domain-containing protein, partial [Acetobacteraceae bacterium]
ESTHHALKYRRCEGEIRIINHDGHGWWDPQGSAEGDVFDLVQHLDPSLNFGQVLKELRRLIGVAPTFPEALRPSRWNRPDRPIAKRWKQRPRLRPGSRGWSYLSEQRRIPASILTAAVEADIARDGPFGSAWFAHRGGDGSVTHVEIRGPDYKGSLNGGTKTLFRFGWAGKGVCRLAVTEAPIDALSLAAIEGVRPDTLYLATGGGTGPGTVAAMRDTRYGPQSPLRTPAWLRPRMRTAPGTASRSASPKLPARQAWPIGAIDWNDILQGRAE